MVLETIHVGSDVERHSPAPIRKAKSSQPASLGCFPACLSTTHQLLYNNSYQQYRSQNQHPIPLNLQDTSRLATMSEESEYVTLISSDGYSFIVQRSSACISGAIKRMLDPSCKLEHTVPAAKNFLADRLSQMASPNPKATRAVSRTSSEHTSLILTTKSGGKANMSILSAAASC